MAFHACLNIADAPIPQGAKHAASSIALGAWVLDLADAVNSPVMLAGGIPSSELFNHLSMAEFGAIVHSLHFMRLPL